MKYAKKPKSSLSFIVFYLKKHFPLVILVFLGSVSLSLAMIKSGLIYDFGMGFWGPNGHDGIWHIALINQLAKFSLANPVFAGGKLTNYHFGFDLLAALASRLTGLNPVKLYFQILPPSMAVLIGLLVYRFVREWTGSKKSAWWATFFVYFAGSWGWLVSLIKTGRLGGESMFWANQAVSTLINPPYALSLIILLLGLIKFLDYFEKPDKSNLIICLLLFGILVQIKVYAGIIVLSSLFCLAVFTSILPSIEVNTQKREIWRLFILTLVVSLVIFIPFNLKSPSLLVFSPLWFPRSMLAYADRFGLFKLENARIAYLNSGKWLKWILTEGLAVTIFILGNLGTRVIGFFYGGWWWRMKRKVSEMEVFLFSALIVSLIIPLLFIQKGNPWNTIQFFYYFQFLLAIFAGVVVSNLLGMKPKQSRLHIYIYVTVGLLVGLTLPTTIATLKNDYLPSRPPARVSIEELEALSFLRHRPEGVVLTFPYDPLWKTKFSEPKPLYAYETSAYVSALSGKQTFLEDEMNLEISGYSWQPRKEEETKFFSTSDSTWAKDFLRGSRIKYIYLVKGQKMGLDLGDIDAEKILENGEVTIFEVK